MLPSVKTSRHAVYIEELKKKVDFRPMLVGEQKLILTAIGFNDEQALVNAIIDLVDACTFNKLDVKKLPTHIVDFLYLNIFAKSNGETTDASFTCQNQIEKVNIETLDTGDVDEEGNPITVQEEVRHTVPCARVFVVKIPLTKAIIMYPENFEGSDIISLDDEGAGLKLKAPNLEDFKKIDLKSDKVVEMSEQFIYACIDSVFTSDSVLVPGTDFKADEFKEWMDNLPIEVLTKIDSFVKNLPKLGLDFNVHCPSCKKEYEIGLRGLDDFFV